MADDIVATLNEHLGDLASTMGIQITAADDSQVRGSMPVAGNTQPFGLLHGGANAVLAETLASIAAGMHAYPDGTPVGIDLNCTHHGAAKEGHVYGVATPLKRGGSIVSYAISITDDNDRLICTARLTCLIRRPRQTAQSDR